MDALIQTPPSMVPEKMDASCSRCGGALDLIRVEPAWGRYERHILECRECGKFDSYTQLQQVTAGEPG
jgi:ribosomal protein S14